MNKRSIRAIMNLLGILVPNLLFSQDLIIMRNGDEVKAKVAEILQDQIKYKKWDNQDGPLYTENKSSVFMIKYQNGTKEVFDQQSSATFNNLSPQVLNSNTGGALIQSEAENTIKDFVNNNSFSGGDGWGENGDFNVRSIRVIERITQFSETEATTVVNFNYKDAFSSNPLSLKFTFKRDIQNNWFLTSVKRAISEIGSQHMMNLLSKWKEINIPVKKISLSLPKKDEASVSNVSEIKAKPQLTPGYVGEYKGDKKDGKGKMIYSDGSYYDGEWKDDKRNGYGNLVYNNGDQYSGFWKDNLMDSSGTFTVTTDLNQIIVEKGIYKESKLFNGTWTMTDLTTGVKVETVVKNGIRGKAKTVKN